MIYVNVYIVYIGLIKYQARSKDNLYPKYNTIIKNIQYNKITWSTQIRNLQ